jgi:hypothetical protein
MKKYVVFAVLALAIIMIVPTAFAQSYDSGFQVQNLSTTTAATITITYYKQDGTVDTTVSDSIAADSSNTYFPIGAAAGFNGSVVISSDQPVAAIANILRGQQGASYSGFDGGASTVSLPLINKNNYGIDTWFNVQNAGSADTTVTVAYSDQPTCNETATITAGAAATFDQATNTCLPDGYVGAATITTSGGSDAIVASVMQVASNGLFAYNGFTGGSANPVMPLISANWYGFHTGAQIQNTGSTATDVTVSYTPAGAGQGTACTETKTIQPGTSETFALYAFSLNGSTTSTCTFGEAFNGSMAVTGNTANQDLVAIVNQTNFATNGSAYNGFDPASATNTVVLPLIQDSYGIWTGYNILNVGASDTITCSYSGGTPAQDVSETKGTNEAMSVQNINGVATGALPGNVQGGAGYVGSATCTAGGGGQLLGVVNQATYVSTGGDTTLTYEAFNK